MICRYCGMDSRNPQVCEWCKKQLAAGTYNPHPTGPPAVDLTQPHGYAPVQPVNLAQPPGYAPQLPVNLGQPQPYVPAAPMNLAQPQSNSPSAASLSQPMGHNFGQVAPLEARPHAHAPMNMTQPIPAPPGHLNLTQPIPAGMDMTQPVPQHQFRTSLTGEVIAVEPPPAAIPGFAQPGLPTHAVVRPGTAIPPHLVGLRPGAIGTDLARTSAGTYMASPGQRWEKCLAISFPILLISVWIVHLKPTMLPWISLADFFFVAMALGGTASINSYDDEYLDVGVALMVSLLFGPTIGLVVYVIVGLIKQDFNVAIIALLLSHLLIRFVLLASFPMNAGAFTVLPTLLAFNIIGIMSICLTFGGWMLSSFFRPLNE